MKTTVDLDEILYEQGDIIGEVIVKASVAIKDFLDAAGVPAKPEIDIHELLAENRQIAHLWDVEDVQQVRPDLDDDEAWRVLQDCEHRLDSTQGLTWDTIEQIAADLYPEPKGARWHGRIDVSVQNYTRDAAIEHFTELATLIERKAVNSTTRAVFQPDSFRLVPADDSTDE